MLILNNVTLFSINYLTSVNNGRATNSSRIVHDLRVSPYCGTND